MDDDGNNTTSYLTIHQIKEIAGSLGYVEKKTGRADVLTYSRDSYHPAQYLDQTADNNAKNETCPIPFPITVELFINTGDLCTYLPHPRQKVYRLFHFNALHSPETLSTILRTPWSDLLFSYSDILTQNVYSTPSFPPPSPIEMALERQIAIIDREISDLKFERNEINRRLKEIRTNQPPNTPNANNLPAVIDESIAPDMSINADMYEGNNNKTAEYEAYKGTNSRPGRNLQELGSEGRGSHLLRRPRGSSKSATINGGGRQSSSSSSDQIITNIRSFNRRVVSPADDEEDGSGTFRNITGRDNILRSSVCSYEAPWMSGTDKLGWNEADRSQNRVNRDDFINVIPRKHFDELRRIDSSNDRLRGNQALWSLYIHSNGANDAQSEFEMAYSAKPASSVMLGRGFVVLYDDGSIYWHGICPLLESKIRQQGLVKAAISRTQANHSGSSPSYMGSRPDGAFEKAARVKYIVLGSESNFYVKFDNGRMEWCGQDSFGAAIRRGVNEKRLAVHRVAFGEDGSWLIIWNDGSFEAERMPATLLERLKYRHYAAASKQHINTSADTSSENCGRLSHIKDVTVGPNGEWFIIFKDHSVQADNLPDSLYKALGEIRERSGRVRAITFGEARSWFVRYWDPPLISR